METKTKTSTAPKVAVVPTEKAEAKKVKLLKTGTIEEAKVVEPKEMKPGYEETVKIVNALHQKASHCIRLGFYIDRLEDFEIEQKEEDLLKKDYYTGCSLVIKDDQRREFELKNPVLIQEVIEYLGKRLQAKRSELEAEIILP